MDQANLNEKKWLIRASSKVLGPYSFDEVKDLLVSKKISIIDEVRQPSTRWSYIRENKDFLDIIKKVRKEQEADHEVTVTYTIGQSTPTNINDEATPVPLQPPVYPRHNAPSADNIKSYGSAQDVHLASKIAKKSKLRWAIMAFSAGMVVLVAILFIKKHKSSDELFSEYYQLSLKYKNIGLYDKALSYYHKSKNIRSLKPEEIEPLLPLIISIEKNSVEGRRHLEQFLKQPLRDEKNLVRDNILLALTYLLEGKSQHNLMKAEAYLQKSLGLDPHNVYALTNLAVLNFKANKYAAALDYIDKALLEKKLTPYLLLLKAQLLLTYNKDNIGEVVGDLVPQLHSAILENSFLRKELALFDLYFSTLSKNYKEMSFITDVFFTQPPRDSDNYYKDLYVDWTYTQWEYVEKYCSDLTEQKNDDIIFLSVRAVCMLELGRDSVATQLIKEAMKAQPKNEYVQTSYAYSLYKLGQQAEVEAMIKTMDVKKSIFLNYLQSLICIQNDQIECVEKTLMPLRLSDRRDPFIYYGLAWVEYRKNQTSNAFQYIKQGMDIEPNYVLLIELRDAIESEL